jgi:Anti-sigma factor NepR
LAATPSKVRNQNADEPHLDGSARARIGAELRSIYGETSQLSLPPRFIELLARLEDRSPERS